jgi:zinc protease
VGLTAEYVRGRQTMSAQARLLGYFEMLRGGFEKAEDYLERYRTVDAAQVVEAARRHIRPENLTVVVQLPEGYPAPELAQIQAHLRQVMARPAVGVPTRLPAANKLLLENGLTLLVKPQAAVPLVAMVLAAPGGQAAEPPDKAGLNQLWSQALTRGAGQHSFTQLTTELEGMAASLEGFASRSTVGLSGSFLARDWRRGLELLAEVWTSPTFPPEQVERARAEQAAHLRAQEDSPMSRALRQFRKLLYGDHPYGQDPMGTPQTLAALTRSDLVALHERLRGPGGAVLCLVGEVELEEVAREVTRLFGGLKGQVRASITPPPLPITSRRQEKVTDPKAQQTQIILGYQAPSATDPGRWPLKLAQALLGGQGGRLFVELRDQQSLAYAVQPFYSPSWHAGAFGVYMAVGPGKEAQALAGLDEQLARLARQDPSPEEMARAQSYLLGQEAIAMQAYSAQAMAMTADELMGLGYAHHLRTAQYLQAVTAAQVRAAAARVLAPQGQALLTLGP